MHYIELRVILPAMGVTVAHTIAWGQVFYHLLFASSNFLKLFLSWDILHKAGHDKDRKTA
jgi:hypothetical protein